MTYPTRQFGEDRAVSGGDIPAERRAPPGMIWQCQACGKRAEREALHAANVTKAAKRIAAIRARMA